MRMFLQRIYAMQIILVNWKVRVVAGEKRAYYLSNLGKIRRLVKGRYHITNTDFNTQSCEGRHTIHI